MGLIRAAIGNVYAVIVLALMIMVVGSVCLLRIPVDILPVFNTPAVQVLTYFNGMPASSVEKTITNRIERWVNQAPGAAVVESKSVPGVSVVKVYFRDDIDPNGALTLTNSLALGTLPTLPPNTLPPVVLPFDPTGTLPLGVLTVSNPGLDESRIKDLARIDVRNMLGTVKGSVAPVVVGGKDRTILIYLDPKKLEARNLSPVDVVKALQDGNLMVTPGTAYFGDNQVLLDTNVMVSSVAELNRLPIQIKGGRTVFLEDIGHAEDSNSIQTSRVRINGKQQVFVPIYRQGGASSLQVAEDVRKAIPKMEEQLPEGSKLDFIIDQSEYVRKAIRGLVEEGIIGAILVSLMILIFLGNWRLTVIATLSLPLSIMGAIIGLRVSGNTINVMTLGGLFLAIGPLVDEAIVVLENIHRHMEMGKNSVRASLDGTVEVALPVMIAAMTTVIVLFPVALMPGLGGFLFKPLTLAVGFAMFSSFILSRTFVPSLSAVLLRHHPAEHEADHAAAPGFFKRTYARIDAGLKFLNQRYERYLEVALRNRGKVLAGVALLFGASLLQLRTIGQEFFPQVDAGQITVLVRAPSNSRLDATERRIIEVERFLEEQIPAKERSKIVSEIGLNPDWSAAYTANAGQQDTVIRVQLTEDRKLTAQQYAIKLRHAFAANPKKFADVEVSFDTGGMVSAALNYGASSPIDITIEGGTPEQSLELAREIRNKVAGIKGAADVRVAQRLDAPYLILDVDRTKAANVGLSARDVITQVVAAINSSTSINRNFWIDTKSGNQYFVAVQYEEDPYRTIESLKNVFATGTNHEKPVHLSSLVEMRPSTAAVELNHVALRRVTNVLVNTENRDIGSVAKDISKILPTLKVPKKMRVELKGEYARMKDSFRSLGGGLILASILVYLLLVPLFRSFVSPLIIMFTVPLGLIGVLTILNLTRTTLNVQSEMGVIFLVGIVVSNGVLLLDFANQQRKRGATAREAITRAAAVRFRPIMMTFLATFLDLLPMALGLGKGSESITPLARAVVGGLLTSTFLTLIILPILYTLLIRDRGRPPVDIEAELAAPFSVAH
jgi:multidrug efflux pump subunit AcrB